MGVATAGEGGGGSVSVRCAVEDVVDSSFVLNFFSRVVEVWVGFIVDIGSAEISQLARLDPQVRCLL